MLKKAVLEHHKSVKHALSKEQKKLMNEEKSAQEVKEKCAGWLF